MLVLSTQAIPGRLQCYVFHNGKFVVNNQPFSGDIDGIRYKSTNIKYINTMNCCLGSTVRQNRVLVQFFKNRYKFNGFSYRRFDRVLILS